MPKRNRNSINTPFARTIIFSGVILLLVAFLLMRLETVSTWIGTILSTLRPVIERNLLWTSFKRLRRSLTKIRST